LAGSDRVKSAIAIDPDGLGTPIDWAALFDVP
jgi:hypothetical protein